MNITAAEILEALAQASRQTSHFFVTSIEPDQSQPAGEGQNLPRSWAL